MIKELSSKQMLHIFIITCKDLSINKDVINAQNTIKTHFIYEVQERYFTNPKYFQYEFTTILIEMDQKWNDLAEMLQDYYGKPIMMKNGFKNILQQNYPYMYNFYLAYAQ